MSNSVNLIDAVLYSLIGISIVFAVLLVLIVMILILSSVLSRKKENTPQISDPSPVPAKGSAGEVSTFDVPDKTAALIMAITAEKTGLPLNRLRFISIKEIKDGDVK